MLSNTLLSKTRMCVCVQIKIISPIMSYCSETLDWLHEEPKVGILFRKRKYTHDYHLAKKAINSSTGFYNSPPPFLIKSVPTVPTMPRSITVLKAPKRNSNFAARFLYCHSSIERPGLSLRNLESFP